MANNAQSGPYIGDSDVATLDWLVNFTNLVTADPSAYGLTADDAAQMAMRTEAYAQAFHQAQHPSTRTTNVVKRKDDARAQAEALGRTLAMQVKVNPQITNDQKITLGIRVDDATRTPIGAPQTMPILNIVDAHRGVHTLRYCDVLTPDSRRKPPGVTHMLLFAEIAPPEALTGAEENLRFIAAVTRQPHVVTFDPKGNTGKVVQYKARWLTAKGLLGPWSAGTSMTITGTAEDCEPLSAREVDSASALQLAA